MDSADAYAALMAHTKDTMALDQVAMLLGWDREAMMPAKGAPGRADQAGALASVLHERKTDPRIADWLADIEPSALNAAGQVNVREIRRSYDRASLMPASLASELTRTTTLAQGVWAEARANKSFSEFAPTLKKVLDLSKQRAECLKQTNQTAYDALLDDYEAGATEDEIASTFASLRTGLTSLRERIDGSSKHPEALKGHFPKAKQLKLSKEVAAIFGYDMDAGRIDLVTHPFCSGDRGDVRITTRIDEADPFNCLYSTIHETGHAIYAQGLPAGLNWQPAGEDVSMGVHESQSRFCENQIGRSEPFTAWLYDRFKETFDDFGVDGASTFFAIVNRVEPGYIRTEADEVHYNLHIMMRFDLERQLIAGNLGVDDLEQTWNDRFEADFGAKVPDAALGVLQDVHWSLGLFGYFPTYALGNLYAGCLHEAIKRDVADFDELLRRAELAPITGWMRDKIHAKASLHSPRETVALATGKDPDGKPLLDYLDAKFGALYGG